MYAWTTCYGKGLVNDLPKAHMISCRSRVVWRINWSKSLELCSTMDGVIGDVYLPFEGRWVYKLPMPLVIGASLNFCCGEIANGLLETPPSIVWTEVVTSSRRLKWLSRLCVHTTLALPTLYGEPNESSSNSYREKPNKVNSILLVDIPNLE